MTFLSILCALLIEQLKPLRADNPIYAEIKALAARMEAWFNAGRARHGRLGWLLMMAALILPTILIYWLCSRKRMVESLGGMSKCKSAFAPSASSENLEKIPAPFPPRRGKELRGRLKLAQGVG